ncbi:cytochrome P450 [Nocardia sp. NBC_00565]|uniref:cytochrome P450 n=1 Tax=Nocardia sp. NBC_00565 TaxID=2975993 RepID=UPI002E80E3C5|nr:cytochrome P450 [Nocardia sp. NBC_00565]WUC01508.1 cytochrome P450 [Nocardia sp. NBC_00565]
MSTPQSRAHAPSCPVVHGSPLAFDGPKVPLYSSEFAADPHRVYREMQRQYGSLAPVELAPGVPATLVVGYDTAVRILNDPEHFPADPRTWQKNIPTDCPVLPLMEWRPIASKSTGGDFLRYRQATTASINEVDLYAFHTTVEKIAIPLINTFCQTGTADLISQYSFPLTFGVANALLGCPPEIGQRIAAAMAAMFDGIEAENGNKMLSKAMLELVSLKRTQPGNDITSLLLRHPAELDDVEVVHQVAGFYGAGIEFQQNLIVNTLLLILTDDRFGGSVLGGTLSTRDALDEVLFNDPPLANFLTTYPRQPVLIDDVWLPAHQPIVISMAACNNDPAIRAEDHTGNRSHLAWGIGPHACPAQSLSYLIAQDAIDQLLDALPEIRLAIPADAPTWRPGPFHRALAALPVTFPSSAPLNTY